MRSGVGWWEAVAVAVADGELLAEDRTEMSAACGGVKAIVNALFFALGFGSRTMPAAASRAGKVSVIKV